MSEISKTSISEVSQTSHEAPHFSAGRRSLDYEVRESNGRKVIKFILNPLDEQIEIPRGKDDSEHTRLIPTQIKVEVWKRDKGRCVICQSTKNLHYDHDLPYSKGGSSITEKNVRILCAKCNLKKHDKIE